MLNQPDRRRGGVFLGLTWTQLAKVGVVVSVVASGAFATGTYVQRPGAAAATSAETATHLGRVDERLGLLAGEMRALREFVEAAVRYARFKPQKESRDDRSTVE